MAPRGNPKNVRKVGRVKLSTKKLTKTQKKETKQIVKNALKNEHSLKYFNSNNNDAALAPAISTTPGSLNQVSVLGYSSTTALNDAGALTRYGQQPIIALNLAKPFRQDETDTVLAENAPNGNMVAPKIAKAAFSIERVFSLFARDDATTDVAPANAANNLPITIRLIKVEFKTSVGTQEELDPNLDLFLDYRTNVPTGINQPDFDRLQCRMAKINDKKYRKLMDTMFTINQNNIIVPQNNTNMWHMPDFFTKAGPAVKHITTNFQLSSRKNQKLYYEDPNGAVTLDTFTSGGKRQLLLYHCWYENGHLLLGGENQPTAPTAEDIQIKHKRQSAFVDTM